MGKAFKGRIQEAKKPMNFGSENAHEPTCNPPGSTKKALAKTFQMTLMVALVTDSSCT